MTSTRELSLRGLLLGMIITLVFTSANVYLGLKMGMTIASSIPATIISMSVLRVLRNTSILENNIVQTQASASAAISCVFATLPAFIIMGFWGHFPFWPVFSATAAGGIVGVIFTVPLRHALLNRHNLTFPEGVACAHILEAGFADQSGLSLRLLGKATIVSACFTFLTSGLRWLTGGFTVIRSAGNAVFCLQGAWSTALLGVGYLIGLGGGIAMLVGVAIAWLIAVPLIGAQTGISASEGHLLEFASTIWMSRVRFIGAGTIAVASLWTLAQLAPGVIDGLKTLWTSRNAQDTAPCERDLPAWFLISTVIAVAITLFLSFYSFLPSHNVQTALFTIASVALCLILSFLVAASCGYMAGLIGASSSPISGVMIIAIIAICLVFRGLRDIGSRASQLFPHEGGLDVAFALFVLTALTASAAISNDNLQDLKTGQLVSATPWKQQIALIIGCVVGAAITAPILNLLHEAYGFAGEVSAHGGNLVLTAPQATLMLSLARGILGGDMDWAMFTIGAVTGISFIFFERFLQTKGLTLPALAVGMGIYLPSDVSVTIALGGAVAYVTQKWSRRQASDRTDQPGTLVACGFIVGESLMGIAIAGINVVRPDILDRFTPPSPELRQISSAFIFAAITFWIGRVSARGWTKI